MNNEDMSDVIKNLSGMLNNANIPDNVKDMLSNLQNSNNSNSSSGSNTASNSDVSSDSSSTGISPEMLEKLSSMLNGSTNNSSSSSTSSQSSGIDMETLLKISNIISKMNNSQNDARANLLLSLKPYLKESRRGKVEQYVKLLNMSKVLEIINPNGGENSKWWCLILFLDFLIIIIHIILILDGGNSHFNTNCVNNFNKPSSVNSVDDFNDTYDTISDEKNRNLGSDDFDNDSDNLDFFEIFGLKLYFDDILLICIIFFLYNEGVKDQGLFIALILLLLS